jgi:hypothetical protein
MKATLAFSLLTSVSLLAPSHAAAAADDALVSTHRPSDKTTKVKVSTVEQLEAFLRKNYAKASQSLSDSLGAAPRDFPEAAFRAFCKPFMPELSKLGNLEQIRAQTATINTIGQMVALVRVAFAHEMKKLETPTSFGSYIPRFEMTEYYKRACHPHFLKFQEMVTHVLALAQKKDELKKEATAALTQPYGSSDTLKIAWIRDNNGIVPIPFLAAKNKSISLDFFPYGYWGDGLQRSMVFVDGKLITAPGIYVHTLENDNFRFIRAGGLSLGFSNAPFMVRTPNNHPAVTTLLSLEVFRIGANPTDLNAFIALPETADEQKEFEAAFLEELMEDQQKGDEAFAEKLITGYLHALEHVEPPEIETSSGAAAAATSEVAAVTTSGDTSTLDIITKHIDSLYEEQVLAEQAETSRRVAEDARKAAEGSAAKKGGAAKKGKAKPAAATPTPAEHAAEFSPEEKEALRKKIFEGLKERGRTKWRTLARTIIAALKSAYADDTVMISVTGKGSHFMLHAAGETASDGVTIVRPHGKADRTISAGEARGLAENLIDLTFKLMAPKPTER